jgi:site-specific DNA recombinase
MTKPPEKSKVVRKLRCAVYTRKSSEEGLEQEFNSLHAQREACEAYIASQRSEGWVLVRDQYDDGGISGGTLERPGLQAAAGGHRGRAGRRGRGLQDRPPQPLAGRLRQAGRGVRPQRRDLRLGDAVVQHDHVDGAADAEHPALLRPVRARGDGRAHPRQGRRQPEEGHVDGRRPALRLPRREPEAGDRRRARAAHVRWIFARFLEIGSGTELAREVAKRGIRTPAATGSTRSTSTGC